MLSRCDQAFFAFGRGWNAIFPSILTLLHLPFPVFQSLECRFFITSFCPLFSEFIVSALASSRSGIRPPWMGLIAAILQCKMFFPLSLNNLFAYPIALLLAVYNSNKPFAAVLTFFDGNHLARAGKSPNFAAENLKANHRGCYHPR